LDSSDSAVALSPNLKTDRYEVTRILLDDKMTLVVRDNDGHEWTGDVAQDLIFNLAGIPNTGSVGDRINSFTRLFWLGVGQQTGFFEAQGKERKKIIEGITPFKKLASMEKEVAARIKVHAAKAEEYAEEASASKGVARTLRAELFKAIPASLLKAAAPGGETSDSKEVRGRIEAEMSGLPSREKIAGLEDSLRGEIATLASAAIEADRLVELVRSAEKNEAEVAATLGGRTQDDVEAEIGELNSIMQDSAKLSDALRETRMAGRELRSKINSVDSDLTRAKSDLDRLARTEATRERAVAFFNKMVKTCDAFGSKSSKSLIKESHQHPPVEISIDLIESQMREVKDASLELIARCTAAGFTSSGLTPTKGESENDLEGLVDGVALVIKSGVSDGLAAKARQMENEAEAEREKVIGKSSSISRLENEIARVVSLRSAMDANLDSTRRLERDASEIITNFAEGSTAAILAAVVVGEVDPESLEKIVAKASSDATGSRIKSLKSLTTAGAGLEFKLAQITDIKALKSAGEAARRDAVAGIDSGDRHAAFLVSASASVASAIGSVVGEMESSASILAELRTADAEAALAVETLGGELAVSRSQRDARRRDVANLETTINELSKTPVNPVDLPSLHDSLNFEAADAAKAPSCGHCGAPLSEVNLTRHLDEAKADLTLIESKVLDIEARLTAARDDRSLIKGGLAEAADATSRGESLLASILDAAMGVLGQFDIKPAIAGTIPEPNSTTNPKLGKVEKAAFFLASVVEEGIYVSLDPVVARIEALAIEGGAMGKQLADSEKVLSGLMTDFFGKDVVFNGDAPNASSIDLSRARELVQGLSKTIQVETEASRARVASLTAAASQLAASSEGIKAMTDRILSSATRHLATLADENAVAQLAISTKKLTTLIDAKTTEKATLEASLAKVASSDAKRESLAFLGLENISESGHDVSLSSSSQDDELRILGLLESFSADVAATVDGLLANLKKVAEKTSAVRTARESAMAVEAFLTKNFATSSKSDLELAAESKRSELVKVKASAEAVKVRDNLLRLAVETEEAEARVDLYTDMTQTETEELESLQVIKGILAPNGDARTLAVADTVALVVAETNRSLRSLDLTKNLSIDLKLEKDEDGQPTIETHFQVDGDSSGKILPSESQRMIVGICVDLAVRDLLAKDSFIIIDEPETGLDDEVKRKFMNFLKAAARQVVFVTNTAAAGFEKVVTTSDIRKTKTSKRDEIESMAKNAKELARRGTGEKRSTTTARRSKTKITTGEDTASIVSNENNDLETSISGSGSVDDGEI
jgi:DNA repair exonuclease SbcCD ATPase subunit